MKRIPPFRLVSKRFYDPHAASASISELSADPAHLEVKVGYICILHSWYSEMNFHPHIHTILLGGGLTSQNKRKDNGNDFFLPIQVISKVFRGKYMDEEKVTFSVKDYKNGGQWKELTLSGIEFIRRFLMHVPPKRFVRIRHYGLLCSRTKKQKLTLCRNLLGCQKYISKLHNLEIPEILEQLYGIKVSVCKTCIIVGKSKRLKVHRYWLPERSLCSIMSNRKWCKRRGSSLESQNCFFVYPIIDSNLKNL